MVTAPVGMALTEKGSVLQVAEIVGKAKRPSVIWLHFQDCTGCTETLLRTSTPDVAHLILDVDDGLGRAGRSGVAPSDGRERRQICAGADFFGITPPEVLLVGIQAGSYEAG